MTFGRLGTLDLTRRVTHPRLFTCEPLRDSCAPCGPLSRPHLLAAPDAAYFFFAPAFGGRLKFFTPSTISRRASSGPPQPSTFTHLPGSRSL
jgi:hypothetical protein